MGQDKFQIELCTVYLGLPVLFSFANFYSTVLIQKALFTGKDLASHDFGLGTMLIAWAAAILWAAAIFLVFFKWKVGRPSVAGFIMGGLLSVPVTVLLALPFGLENIFGAAEGVFYLLSLGGLIEPGRPGTEGLIGWLVLGGGLLSFSGTMITLKRHRRKGFGKAGLSIVVALLILPKIAWSYGEQIHTLLLTKEAAELVHESNQEKYPELIANITNMKAGTLDEDAGDAGTRVRNHFYRPTDGSGILGFDSARKKLQDNAFFASALATYRNNSKPKSEAYGLLGHAMHLATQDMFSPPHVHLDIHFTLEVFGGPTFAPFSSETWASENLPAIAANPAAFATSIGAVSGAADVELAGNAINTYKSSRIQGTVEKDVSNPATGILNTMFPQTHSQKIVYEPDFRCAVSDPENPGVCFLFEDKWVLTGVGDCFEFGGCNANPAAEDEWWIAKNFASEPSGTKYFYVENAALANPTTYKGTNPAGKSLAELWTVGPDKLIAKGMAQSAGMIKSFADQVDALRPEITLFSENPPEVPGTGSDIEIEPGGTSSSDQLHVQVVDPGNSSFPRPSGVYKVALKNTGTGAEVDSVDFSGENSVLQPFFGLVEGSYEVETCDGLANCTLVIVDIAGRCFLVENGKLIFFRFASENARSPSFGGVHYCETHARSITAGGLWAGGRV